MPVQPDPPECVILDPIEQITQIAGSTLGGSAKACSYVIKKVEKVIFDAPSPPYVR